MKPSTTSIQLISCFARSFFISVELLSSGGLVRQKVGFSWLDAVPERESCILELSPGWILHERLPYLHKILQLSCMWQGLHLLCYLFDEFLSDWFVPSLSKTRPFFEVRLVGGLLSFSMIFVVRLVHLVRHSTVPTGPAVEKTAATYRPLVHLTRWFSTLRHNADCLWQGRISPYFLHQCIRDHLWPSMWILPSRILFGSKDSSSDSEELLGWEEVLNLFTGGISASISDQEYISCKSVQLP